MRPPSPRPSLRRAVLLCAGLLALAACSAEKGDWERASTANTADAYRQYVEKHPASPFAAEARKKWEALDFAAADAIGTAEALTGFLRTHPAEANAGAARSKRSLLVNGFSVDARPVRRVKRLRGVFSGDWLVKEPAKNTGVIFRVKFQIAKEPLDLGLHELDLSFLWNGKKVSVGCSGASVTGEDGNEGGIWLFADPEKNQSFSMALKKGNDDWSLVFALPSDATGMVITCKDQEISRAYEMSEFLSGKKQEDE